MTHRRNGNGLTALLDRFFSPFGGFQVQRQRWKVERTFGWFIRYRRLARDDESLPSSSEALIQVSAIKLFLNRLTPFRPLRTSFRHSLKISWLAVHDRHVGDNDENSSVCGLELVAPEQFHTDTCQIFEVKSSPVCGKAGVCAAWKNESHWAVRLLAEEVARQQDGLLSILQLGKEEVIAEKRIR